MSDPSTRASVEAADRAPDGGSDEDVIAALAARQLGALDELYDRYGAMAYSIAYRITRDAALAEDAVQDAFLGLWRNAHRYAPGKASVRTWLLSIVHHRAIDAVRRRRPTVDIPEQDAGPSPDALVVPDVWAEVAGRLDREAITGALAALPMAQREAIELAYWRGLTQQEIAETTGAPLGTVKSRVRLGLLALRRELLPDGPSRGDNAGAEDHP